MSPPRIVRIVSDDDVSNALEFLMRNAKFIGAARRRLMEAESLVKRTKALVMRQHGTLSLGAQEREAILDKSYQDAEAAVAKEAGRLEYLKALREAHAAKIECWRTEQSTLRSMKI